MDPSIQPPTVQQPRKESETEEGLIILQEPHSGRQVEIKIDALVSTQEETNVTTETPNRPKNNARSPTRDFLTASKISLIFSPKNRRIGISTARKIDEEYKAEEVSPKKWVIYDMERLGFEEEQIKEAITLMQNFPEDLTKEKLMSEVVERFAEKVMTLDEALENLGRNETRTFGEPQIIDAVVIEMGKVQKEERKADEEKLVLCNVCFNELSEDEVKPLLKCSHAFCKSCYSLYIVQSVKENKVLDIKCPYAGCDEKFQERQIVDLLNKEQGERYIRLKNIAVLNRNPSLRWCIRPGCDKYVVGNGKRNRLVCECQAEICFNCGNKYHEGKSCNAAVDKMYKKYAEDKHIQNCPQCKSSVEKNGGCNHMTCIRCAYQWCWLCDKKYTYDHYEMTNPDHCAKLGLKKKISEDESVETGSRFTYWTHISEEPVKFLAFPLFIVITSLLLPQFVYKIWSKKKNGIEYDVIGNSSTELLLLFSLLGVLLLPLSLIYILTCTLVDGFFDFWIWFCGAAFGKDITKMCPKPLMPVIF